jgi:hypothetical protein
MGLWNSGYFGLTHDPMTGSDKHDNQISGSGKGW